MEEASGVMWLAMTVGAVAILGVVIAYSMLKNRKITPAKHERSEQATARVYAEESRDQPR